MSRRPPQTRDRSGYLSEDTIAALTTAPGGAIAVVRVSGPAAFSALEMLAPGPKRAQSEPRKMIRARLVDPGETGPFAEIDDALFVRFVAPESFTGENVVEFHLHGGGFIASRVLEVLNRVGIRQALPGEFSFRAVRNGKLSLSQATAVADLIGASNQNAVSLALEKLSGTQNKLISQLARDLRNLAVLGEAGIDFADQDLDEVGLPRLKQKLTAVIAPLETLYQSYRKGTRIQDGVRVSFAGLPNAGKSSFFNALLGEDRSIVSEIPGTTRDVVRERLTLTGTRHTITLRLEDTAGLRSTDNVVEKIGIERSRKAAQDADLILLIVDSSGATSDLTHDAFEQWHLLGTPSSKALGVLTKTDLIASSGQPSKINECRKLFGVERWITTSALNGAGISEAVEAITDFAGQWLERSPGEVVLTRIEEMESAETALDHLRRAETAAEIDLFAADLRQALTALGPLIGETLPDDILGQIFSEFCIGK